VKPFVGDFNGDGANDLFWYNGGNLIGFTERVWYFRPNMSRTYEDRSVATGGATDLPIRLRRTSSAVESHATGR